MSWCDKLASTPAVGVKLEKVFVPLATLLQPLTPIVSKWVDKDKPAFSIDQHDPFAASLTTFDGYQYIFGPEAFAVEFRHRLRFQPQSAGPPTAELLSKPLPYSELLSEVTRRFLELLQVTTAGTTRRLERIGIVTTTLVSEDEMPPGIRRFIKQLGKPWDDIPEFYNIVLSTLLPDTKRTVSYDRCIHSITKPEDGEGLVTIRLDWQRYLDEGRTLSIAALEELIGAATKDALSYFEDIGEGERFNE